MTVVPGGSATAATLLWRWRGCDVATWRQAANVTMARRVCQHVMACNNINIARARLAHHGNQNLAARRRTLTRAWRRASCV